MDLIIYHNGCPDGFTAAYIAKKKYPEAQLVPRDHGLEPPYDLVAGKDVLVVDFSWRTREQNIKMAESAKSFRILDHHKTAKAELEGLDFAVFDMERSGAGLAWDYLFGKDENFKVEIFRDGLPTGEFLEAEPLERPWWVNYVEDRDLWRHQFPHSKEINAYIGTLPMTVEAWDNLNRLSPSDAENSGKGALAHIEHYVREATKHAQFGELFGYRTSVINLPYLNCSEVGNEMAKQAGISVTYFERGDGIIQFSLRSIGDIDVSQIARSFNGGGHKNAAGFQLGLYAGRDLVDTILNRHKNNT